MWRDAVLLERIRWLAPRNEICVRDFDGGIEDIGTGEAAWTACHQTWHGRNDAANVVDVAPRERKALDQRFQEIR